MKPDNRLKPLRANPLAITAHKLRSGDLDLAEHVNEACDRIDTIEPFVRSLLPEPDRRARLLEEAKRLNGRFPEPGSRPPLFGILVGVKDLFRVNGFQTRCGSKLPPELFVGPEAKCVTALREAGTLILGKTVTTEFAYREPGPTRNPHNLTHTPGGSSSGSAAATSAGFCELATGSQTIGSVIRPAAFCGIVGFKPSLGRIATDGVIPFSTAIDHVGLFTQDVDGMAVAASVLCRGWKAVPPAPRAVLGIPDGPYLAQVSKEGITAFELQCGKLQRAGHTLRRVPLFANIESIRQRHIWMISYEMAQVHKEWFPKYEPLYRPLTAQLIRDGQAVRPEQLAAGRAGIIELRNEMHAWMDKEGIDLWICPPAPGTAPEGITHTGNPCMNLPWTHSGMPAISLPAGRAPNGMPIGLQCVAGFMDDERLLAWASDLERSWSRPQDVEG